MLASFMFYPVVNILFEDNNAVLVLSFLALSIFRICVSIADFEQVDCGWIYIIISSVQKPSLLKF